MREWMKFPARSSSVVVEIRGGAIVVHAVSGTANGYWEKRYSDDGEHVWSVDMWGAKLSRMVSLTVCWFGTSRCVDAPANFVSWTRSEALVAAEEGQPGNEDVIRISKM